MREDEEEEEEGTDLSDHEEKNKTAARMRRKDEERERKITHAQNQFSQFRLSFEEGTKVRGMSKTSKERKITRVTRTKGEVSIC